MADANGSSVTPEEVEALRQQLEALQVGQCAPSRPPHAAAAASDPDPNARMPRTKSSLFL